MLPNRLKAFITVVELDSFTRAAETLYTSQSSLSQQIRTLENTLGFELFNHTTHRVKLTNAGRVFYPRARQMLSVYYDSILEARLANEQKPQQPLRVGCLYDQITQYWVDLFHISPEIEQRFKPSAMRFDNRLTLYQALQQRHIDICIQMENYAITDAGLEFIPLTTCPEMCISMYSSVRPDKKYFDIEDLDPYRIAFHYPQGYVKYEDELRAELNRRRGLTMLLNPSDFPKADYGIPIMLIMPQVRYPTGKEKYACPLRWGEGVRIGFVIHPECKSNVREYALTLQQLIRVNGSPWLHG